MIIVLDSNEYILFLNNDTSLLNNLFVREDISVYISNLIIRKVLRNIDEKLKKKFYQSLFRRNIIIKEQETSPKLFEKYSKLGFKRGDMIIAAFCESVEANYLVTENRDFLKSKGLKFKILSLKEFLKRDLNS